METTFDYLRAHAAELGARILETYPPLQSTKDPVAPAVGNTSAQGAPGTGTCHHRHGEISAHRRRPRASSPSAARARPLWRLGTIHVLADGRPSTTLVMCPSHITHKWAREVLLTIPRARAFLIEDMRNGGDPKTAAWHLRSEVEQRQDSV